MITGFLNLGTGEIILIAVVILLLFGGRKIPELMRGLGKGVRSFKDGLNEVTDEVNRQDDSDRKGSDKR
ncbi:MAG: twin-arginine translocase TatA/TatE family subunit [Candidatus Amulumruptor sp.]|jgi:twin arginine-targeting protein translocase, tatA/E family